MKIVHVVVVGNTQLRLKLQLFASSLIYIYIYMLCQHVLWDKVCGICYTVIETMRLSIANAKVLHKMCEGIYIYMYNK